MNYVFFAIVDAMKSGYINSIDTPFLWNLRNGGVFCKNIITSAGFTQRSALFTGTYPDVTGNFTMFTYDLETSPFRRHGIAPWKLSLIQQGYDYFAPKQYRHRQIIAFGLKRLFREIKKYYVGSIGHVSMKVSPVAWPANIDFRVLDNISISEDNVPIYSEHALKVESIFDVFRENSTSFNYLMWPNSGGNDDDTQRDTLVALDEAVQVYLLQFSESDSLVHKHGISSTMRRRVMAEIDRKFRQLDANIRDKLGDFYWVIVGDHGMAEVKDYFDAKRAILEQATKHNVKLNRDFLFFLESTMVRGKSLTDRGHQFLVDIFCTEPFQSKGKIIDEQLARAYRIPLPDPRYGDVIWWAHSGVLIFPDFFHNWDDRYKAMHGYDSYHPDSKGTALIYGPKIVSRIVDEARLIDLCPTLCDLVGVRHPKNNEGESLVG